MIDPSTLDYDDFAAVATPALQCAGCQTAQYVMIESIGPVKPRIAGRVAVEYSCRKCGSFHAHDATVQQVAVLLNAAATAPRVRNLGRHCLQCGEPMDEFEEGDSRLHPAECSQNGATGAAAVQARAVKCHCAARMRRHSPSRDIHPP